MKLYEHNGFTVWTAPMQSGIGHDASKEYNVYVIIRNETGQPFVRVNLKSVAELVGLPKE